MSKLKTVYVIERGGVSIDERGYLGGSHWRSLNKADRYMTEDVAVATYKKTALDGGVLIKTDSEFKQWTTQYTI